MSRNKTMTTVYLERWQDEALKTISRETGCPAAELIRRGVDLVILEQVPEGATSLARCAPMYGTCGMISGHSGRCNAWIGPWASTPDGRPRDDA